MDEPTSSLESALGELAQQLTAAQLSEPNSELETIRTRIKAANRNASPSKIQEIRSDLIAAVQAIVHSADVAANQQSESARSLSPEEVAAIKQRFQACLQYVCDRGNGKGKPLDGDLAWLARLRV